MSDNTKIEWTDATVNAVNGCSVVSPGCTNCYAMRLAGTRLKHHPSRAGLTIDTKAGPVWNGTIKVNYDAMMQPLSWRRPRRLFWNAHGDLFHVAVPVETIAQVFGVAIAAYHLHGHVSQLLTKRPDRQRDLLMRPEFWDEVNANAGMHVMERVDPLDRRRDDARATLEDYSPDAPPPGLWLGTSTEDQRRADERVPRLLETPAAVRFLSCEPLLGPVNITDAVWGNSAPLASLSASIDWVIAGGESGPGARPMHPDWVRSLRDQCARTGTPFFFKQWGEWAPADAVGIVKDGPVTDRRGNVRDLMNRYVVAAGDAWGRRVMAHSFTEHATDLVYRVGKETAGRLLDGVEHSGMPA